MSTASFEDLFRSAEALSDDQKLELAQRPIERVGATLGQVFPSI